MDSILSVMHYLEIMDDSFLDEATLWQKLTETIAMIKFTCQKSHITDSLVTND
jgi:hypothetical protein